MIFVEDNLLLQTPDVRAIRAEFEFIFILTLFYANLMTNFLFSCY